MDKEYYSRGRKRVNILNLCRDIFIAALPQGLRPLSIRLIPYRPDFIFLTHPRNEDDIWATIPVAKFFSRISRRLVKLILNLSPCYIVANVKAPDEKKGYVISVTELPEDLFSKRELVTTLAKRLISFFSKISDHKTYVGLAAWWPIVTNSGQLFNKYAQKNNMVEITSGHTTTLLSLYLSINKLAEATQKHLTNSSVLILGVGKIGGSLAVLLANKVKKIGLLDKSYIRLKSIQKILNEKHLNTTIELIHVTDSNAEEIILRKIQEYDLTSCTTSNVGLLIDDQAKLSNCLILDDSRPEAFPRIFSREKHAIILEGGLMKINGVSLDSNFGFGKENNIFGCLAEAIILALDTSNKLKPNTGEIDFQNFNAFVEFCHRRGIVAGDFKCGEKFLTEDEIRKIARMENRDAISNKI